MHQVKVDIKSPYPKFQVALFWQAQFLQSFKFHSSASVLIYTFLMITSFDRLAVHMIKDSEGSYIQMTNC